MADSDLIDRDDDDGAAEAGPRKRLDDNEGLLKRLTRWEREAKTHWSKWREEARLCYDYVAGHQWSSEDKSALLDQMRQPVTFNRIGPMVDAVIGAEILNRQETRYAPRELGDVQVNELITAADEWARDLSDTEDEESDAFSDTVICGMGWTETVMEYDDDPEGRLVDHRLDPMEMWSDPSAKKRNVADARYLIRGRYRDKEDLPRNWRSKLADITVSDPDTDDVKQGTTGPGDDYERDAKEIDNTSNKRKVWIRHFQWWDHETVYRVADPMTGKVVTIPAKKAKKLGEMFLKNGLRPPEMVKIEQKKFRQAFVAGNTILEESAIEANAFTFKAITGKRDRKTNTFYGVVRAMIDPQMWGNKFFVQIMHILNTSARGGLLYETGAFVNPRKALDDWSKPQAPIELQVGALSGQKPKVEERTAVNFPHGTDKMMEFALNNLPQTSGINLELMGLAQQEQPGVLEMHRKRAGYAILAVFFDSLRRYRKMKGRVRLYFIQHYLSDGRLIRIKGQDNTMQYVPLAKQDDTATYDVIVDEAPMSPNQKDMVWQMIMGLMPMLSKLQLPPDIWATLVQYSPLPSAVSEKITKSITDAAQQPPPPDPKLLQIQAEMKRDQEQAQMDMFAAQEERQQDREKHAEEMQALRAKTEATVIAANAKMATVQVQQQTAQQMAAVKTRSATEQANIKMSTARALANEKMKAKPKPKAKQAA